MIALIEALRFRCLKDVRQPLGPFHVLVGPNASGKTTFLDVVAFLSRLVSSGLDAAVGERTQVFSDLVWGRSDNTLELAIEAEIPAELRDSLRDSGLRRVRYQVRVGVIAETGETSIRGETLRLVDAAPLPDVPQTLFPAASEGRRSLGPRLVLNRSPRRSPRIASRRTRHQAIATKLSMTDSFTPEDGSGTPTHFRLGPRKSAVGNLPEDETKFPVATWFKRLLIEGVQPFVLNSLLIRKASPPGQTRRFKTDGSNLPWMIAGLERRHPKRLRDWLAHLRTALPDLESIRTVEREDDKHRYLLLRYRGGLEVPSWMASDGTLRLLALTLPAYLPEFSGVYLIEEPENGIHPRAVETMFQSLSSVYGAQTLMATHSPVILAMVQPAQVLCFAKTDAGATDIVSGRDHPALRDWRGESDLGVLFAGGVLG